MPFVAIALCVSLVLGGTVAITNTPAGERAIESAAAAWTETKAKVQNEFSAIASSSQKMSAEADVHAETKNDLKIESGNRNDQHSDDKNSNKFDIKTDLETQVKIF